ncbi:hypothetical protein CRUP_032851, partial [Coryphaenoides rupestris]
CRHATISKFFGNAVPSCSGACDYCRDPRVVRAQLEKASTLSTRIANQTQAPRGAFGCPSGTTLSVQVRRGLPLREASSQKVPRLTVKAREHCLSLLQEVLYDHQGAEKTLNSDIVSLAVDMEYEVFKSSKSSNLYKAAVLKKVSGMKKGTGLPTAPGRVEEDEKGGGVSDRTGSDPATGSRPEQEVDPSSSSSSSLLPPGELGGFTSASQVY